MATVAAIVKNPVMTAHQKPRSVYPPDHPAEELRKAMKAKPSHMAPTTKPKIRAIDALVREELNVRSHTL
jgi:hypothetical protein